MIFTETKLKGAFLVDLEPKFDHRGFFSRSWCRNEFESQGLNAAISQCNISYSKKEGTLRGMHYQDEPFREAKLVRCYSGAIFDVIIDLRRHSQTYCHWYAAKLTSENRTMLYVPEGFAHGFQALEDDTEIFYQVSAPYNAECERGIRWDDPAIGIDWPIPDPILSERDRLFSDYLR